MNIAIKKLENAIDYAHSNFYYRSNSTICRKFVTWGHSYGIIMMYFPKMVTLKEQLKFNQP